MTKINHFSQVHTKTNTLTLLITVCKMDTQKKGSSYDIVFEN